MTEAYDGRQVVGMDLHRRRSVLVRMTEDGRKLETVRIDNSPPALRAVLARAGKNPRVVVEATYGWYWAADVLQAAGAEVHLAHPLGVKAFSYRRVKNDEKDAADLADLLRLGRLPEAWIAPPQVRELRELTRYRIKLVHQRSSGKDQVHAVLAKLGIPVPCSDLFGAFGSAWLDGLDLPQPYAGKVASLRQLIGWLTGEISLLDEVIADFLGCLPALPGGAAAARDRAGAGRGGRRRDRRRQPVPQPRSPVQPGRADPAAPRVRPQGRPRARHQAGLADPAVGHGGGNPAPARRQPAPRAQGPHHRPPRQRGQEHRQGRRGPQAAHLRLLRAA
jgi:Transposase